MKKIDFSMLLLVFLPNFAYADCSNMVNNECRVWQNSGTCGNNCYYSYNKNTGILTVTGGEDASIQDNFFNKKYYENDAKEIPINKIIIDGNFSTIGSLAFGNTYSRIYGKDGAIVLDKTGNNPFGSNEIRTNIILSDKATYLDTGTLLNTNIYGNIIIPENIKNLNWDSFRYFSLHGQILCEATNACKKEISDSCKNDDCKDRVSKILDKVVPYPDGCAKIGITGCSKCKNESFRLNDGECDRIRYTPAEAAQVLKDTDNEIIMTFKVNR